MVSHKGLKFYVDLRDLTLQYPIPRLCALCMDFSGGLSSRRAFWGGLALCECVIVHRKKEAQHRQTNIPFEWLNDHLLQNY